MRHDLFIAGFGGQGVLLAGNLLSYAAIIEEKNVTFFPAYGVEKRGGAAMCTVVIADGEVGSPVVGFPSVVVALDQSSLDKYGKKVKSGGTLIFNSSLVDSSHFHRSDMEIIAMPMHELALEAGDARMVNMVAIGAYVAKSVAVSFASLTEALCHALPERNHHFIPANIRGLEAGSAYISGLLSSAEKPAAAGK